MDACNVACLSVCTCVILFCALCHISPPSFLPAFPPILTTQPTPLQVVMFVIIRDRTRGFIEDRSLGRTVDGLVGRVNGRYGHTDYCPVKYVKGHLTVRPRWRCSWLCRGHGRSIYVKGHLTVRPRRGCSWLCRGRGRSMVVKGHRGVVGCVEVDRLIDVHTLSRRTRMCCAPSGAGVVVDGFTCTLTTTMAERIDGMHASHPNHQHTHQPQHRTRRYDCPDRPTHHTPHTKHRTRR